MSTPQPKDHRDLLKRALLKIDTLQAQFDKQREPIAIVGMSLRFPNGANDPEKFWQLLREGVDCITEIPASRWNVEDYYDPDPDAPGKMYTRCAGFLDQVDQFDPQFFGIAPREAQSMDPQQRLLLEVTWEALERAGQSPSKLAGSRTGVYIGISGNDYSHLHSTAGGSEHIDTYFGAGVAHSIASGRISYVLGLQGPSVSVDTACSASLTAVHLACQSLRAGETEMALAGGVNVILSPDGIITASQARMLSPEGRCKTFDASANGYVRSEGCAIIVLKRLSDAIASGDNILALIRGTAANQDGRSGGLTAPNGEAQQAVIRAALVNANLKPEDISYLETHGTGTSLGDPIEVQSLGAVFSESHSKEQPLLLGAVKSNIGHLEAAAGIAGLIKTILALQHQELPPSLHVQQLNPHIAWEKLPVKVTTALTPWKIANGKRIAGVSSFGFSGTNVHVILEGAKEDKKEKEPSLNLTAERPCHVLTLSAKSDEALRELALRYERHLVSHYDSPLEGGQGGVARDLRNCDEDARFNNTLLNPPSMGDSNHSPLGVDVARDLTNTFANICFTANAGRAHFNHRLALLAESTEQAHAKLAAFVNGEMLAALQHGKVEDGHRAEVAFLFTGQGAQYLNMGKQLYETQPVFRAALNKCDELLRPYLEVPLLSVLFSKQHSAPLSNTEVCSPPNNSVILEGTSLATGTMPSAREDSSRMTYPLEGNSNFSLTTDHCSLNTDHWLHQTAYTQPALFAIEYALAELWRSWGITPSFVMGHSIGEYVAACVAGVFSLEDGLKLIAARGRLMQALPLNGSMAAVFANEETVRKTILPYLDKVDVAAINGPANIVISGEREAVNEILRKFESEDVKHKPLTVSHAFHSPLMEPMLDEFERLARDVQYSAPRIPLVSNITGQFVADDEITHAQYWRNHVREAVRFADAMVALHEQGCKIFVELGPSPVLSSMGQRCLPEHAGAWLPSLRKGREDWQQVLETLAGLYVHGVNVDWPRFDHGFVRRRVVLPTYPFQRSRYWSKAAERRVKGEGRRARAASPSLHPLLGARLRSALKEVQFEAQVEVHAQPFLREHQFYGTPVFPATAYVEMALAAAQEIYGASEHVIQQCNLHEALLLPEEETRLVQLIFTPETEAQGAFQILSTKANIEHTQEKWTLHASGTLRAHAEAETALVDLQTLQQRCARPLEVKAYYEKFRALGVDYGQSFQGLSRLWQGKGEALAEIQLTDDSENRFRFHPGLLDACFQLFGATIVAEEEAGEEDKVYMPASMERLNVFRDRATRFWCHAQLREGHAKGSETLRGDLCLFDESGAPIAKIESLRFKRVTRAALQRVSLKSFEEGFYEVQWQKQTLAEAAPAIVQSPAAKWLIFADEEGLGAAMAEQLERHNTSAVFVRKSKSFARVNENEWRLNPERREDFERFFSEAFSKETGCRTLVYAWSLDAQITEATSAEELLATEKSLCGSTLNLVQVLAQMNWPNPPRLWLLTRGAHAVGDESIMTHFTQSISYKSSEHAQNNSPLKGEIRGAPSFDAMNMPVQASLWGLANVISLEHPALQCSRIDLDPKTLEAHRREASCLLDEMRANTRENQIALRSGERFVARVMPVAAASNRQPTTGNERTAASIPQPVKLEIRQHGVLENLKLVPQKRRAPERGEVEVRVHATGLNFRDVLNALGMYPGDPGPLGNECIGKIVALGEEVNDLNIGEEVMVLAADTFASYVTTDARFVLPMPGHLSVEEAATLPITFLTAHYALNHLAQLKKGERVLIHAAAGGVGLAAIQLAQRAGAEIFATAGSAEKHDYLRALGVKNIFSSRTLDFADEIVQLTNGEGLDIVLNSLAGEFIPKSLSLLRANGRFLEIGKTDVWNEERVKTLKPEIAYHVIYLGQIIHEHPGLIRTLFEELSHAFERGELQPLPFKPFPLEDAVHAYRYMAQAKHIGKVVLVQSDGVEDRRSWIVDRKKKEPQHDPQLTINHQHSTYLLTGGLGALGLHVAKRLVEKGARHMVLVGRKAPSETASAAIAEMENKSAKIVVSQVDISQAEEVRRVLEEISKTLPPLRGVIHSAGVLDDGVLAQQDWPRFAKVMAPKILGAWHLHCLTKELPLDFFVLFSSIASMFGAPSQGNYAAANAFMDGLAHYRRAHGLPALSINWGPWAEGGMVTGLGGRGASRLSQQGLSLINPEQGVQALERLLGSPGAQAAVVPVNWTKFLQQFKSEEAPLFFAQVAKTIQPQNNDMNAAPRALDIVKELERALPSERREVLTAHVREQVVKVLGLEASQAPELQQGLTDLGMDSLMAVELSNRLRTSLGRTLPSTLAFEYPTVAALTNYIATEVLRLDTSEEADVQQTEAQNGKADIQQEIDKIAAEELEVSLLKELEEAGY